MIGDGIEGVGFAIPYTKIEEALNIKFELFWTFGKFRTFRKLENEFKPSLYLFL